MDIFSLDSENAKNLGLGAMVFSVVGLLIVLKFVKSLVSKILLLAIFGTIAYFSFTQRDALSICVAKLEAASASEVTQTSCSFFGQDISLKSISK
ncbi:MAG: hypothetical protein EBU22_00145 [Actinobacteria bacterium]|nr:hypothetical protein [Actinomycetota bacterium]NCU80548.1 hypothetical protein [Acidimicrobiia bacterium]NDF66594.1 hypothetical protein [Actinomycetota bacterium]